MTTAEHIKTEPHTQKPCATIYIRVSRTEQEEGTSLDTQEQRCRAYAAEQGYTVAAVFREVWSGADLFERPALAALRDVVRQGPACVVIAYALDRLTRDQNHIAILAYEFQQAGVRLEFVTERFEDSPVGTFLRNASAFVAELERQKIKERTQRGLRARIAAGKPMTGPRPPYGYVWRDAAKTAYAEDPLTAPIVKRIFANVLQGMTLKAIASELTSEGIPTPTGGDFWRHTTIWAMLHHPAYMGQASAYRWTSVKTTNGKHVPRLRDGAEVIPLPAGVMPALVDVATWQAAQAAVSRNGHHAVRNQGNAERFLLRGGFIRCAGCGQPMHTQISSSGRPAYRCARNYDRPGSCPAPASIGAVLLDGAVWARIEALLQDPDTIARELARLQTDDGSAADLEAVDRLLADIERRRANTARAIAALDDEEAAQPLIAELANLNERKRSLAAQRKGTLSRREQTLEAQSRLDDLQAWCRAVGERLPSLDFQHKRDAVLALGIAVEVYRPGSSPRYIIQASIPLDVPVDKSSGDSATRCATTGSTTATTSSRSPTCSS